MIPRFQTRLAQFVNIESRHRIKPLFVFSTPAGTRIPKWVASMAPHAGVHNFRLGAGPGRPHRRQSFNPQPAGLCHRVMTQFRNDDRVLGWDVWNELTIRAAVRQRRARRQLERVADLLPQSSPGHAPPTLGSH